MHLGIGLGLWPQKAGIDPVALFANGEQGVFYDPSDLSTLFQDAAGTIPVTGAGQPVGLMKDKSGRGNHASQAGATSLPILQTANGLWWLAYDGADDWIATNNIDFTATNKMTVWMGIHKATDTSTGIPCELGIGGSNGSFALVSPNSTGTPTYGYSSRGTATVGGNRTGYPAPHTAVLCMQADIAAPSASLRVNATADVGVTSSQGTGNYGNLPLYIGRRGGTAFQFNGRLYGLIVRGAKSTDVEIAQTEAWMNAKTGAY